MPNINYEQAKNLVKKTLEEHLSGLDSAKMDERRYAVASDVNGTLISKNDYRTENTRTDFGDLLDGFLSDLHDHGIQIYVVSGDIDQAKQDLQRLGLRCFEILENADYDGWSSKSFGMKESAAMYFDDDEQLCDILRIGGGTAFYVHDPKTQSFLEAWSILSEEDKTALLKPWVGAEQDYRMQKLYAQRPDEERSVTDQLAFLLIRRGLSWQQVTETHQYLSRVVPEGEGDSAIEHALPLLEKRVDLHTPGAIADFIQAVYANRHLASDPGSEFPEDPQNS